MLAAIETIGTVVPDQGILDGGPVRSFDVTFSAVEHSKVCVQASRHDFLAFIMASPPNAHLVCKSVKVTVIHGAKKKFKVPAEDGALSRPFDVVLDPEPKECVAPEGYALIGQPMTFEENAVIVEHNKCKTCDFTDKTWEDFEALRDAPEEESALQADDIPQIIKVGDGSTLRFSHGPDKTTGHSFGVVVDQLKSKTLIVSADIRTAGPLPVKDNIGFRLTTPTVGAPGPFDGCINSWIPSIEPSSRSLATFKNRETVHVRSAGPGTTLAITSATLDGEDVTEAVNELVEVMPSGGQQLFCPGGVYEKLGRACPRPFGKHGEAVVDIVFVVQYVSWTHVEFLITRPPGQLAITLCLDGLQYSTQVDVANFKVYEVESLNDADMLPLQKKDVFVNETTNEPWDRYAYANFLNGMSAQSQFLERCRIKSSIEEGLHHIAERDAHKLRKAAQGLGTDDSVLKALLISRVAEDGPGNKHLQAVDSAFQRMYDTTLAEMISSETSGDYQTFLTALVTPKAKLDAIAFDKAMRGLGTDDDLLIELTCTRSNAELIAARKAYAAMFDKDLMTEVTSETSGDYQKLLLRVLEATQDEHRDEEEEECGEDFEGMEAAREAKREESAAAAQKINDAIAGMGTDEDALIRVVCKIPMQLWAPDKIPAVYEANFGQPLEEAISGDVGGDFGQALKMKMKQSKYYVWAELLKQAGPDKLGTDEDTIIRILTCCQSPGLTLKQSIEYLSIIYEEIAGEALADMLDSELSFNFGDAIEQLVDGDPEELSRGDPFTRFGQVSSRWDLIDGTTSGSDWDYKDSHLYVLSWIALLDAYDIKEAMAGWGTDEDTLSNIFSCRTQEQVSLANFCYSDLYADADMIDDISAETSGDYAKLMMYLIRDFG